MENFEFFQSSNVYYKNLIAFKSWDGAVAAGLISRLFYLPMKFRKIIRFSRESIIIGVLFYIDADILGSLIIDRHDCKKPTMANVRLGNLIICEERFNSLSELISEIFDLELDNELLKSINAIESGNIEDVKAKKLLLSRLAYLDVFPYEKIAFAVREQNMDIIWSWVDEKAESDRINMLLERKNLLLENLIETGEGIKIITFSAKDLLEVGAAELIIRQSMEKERLLLITALEGDIVKGMYILSKKLDLIRLMRNLANNGFICGGRSNFGRCKATEKMTLSDFNERLITAIMASYRKL